MGTDANGQQLVNIQNYYPSGALCVGNLATYAKGDCINEFSTGVLIAGSRSTTWRLAPLPDGSFRIVVQSREGGCYRFLSASDSCSESRVSLTTEDYGARQRWYFVEVDPTPSPTPTSTPTPTPTPTPAPLPPPVILSAQVVSNTSANVTFNATEGALSCAVTLTPGGIVGYISPIAQTTNSLFFVNLVPGTNYSAVGICAGATGVSPSSEVVNFTTPANPPETTAPPVTTPQITNVTLLSQTSVNVTFLPTTDAVQCLLYLNNSGPIISTTLNPVPKPVAYANLTGLSTDTVYSALVSCFGPTGLLSTSPPYVFSTSGTPVPTGTPTPTPSPTVAPGAPIVYNASAVAYNIARVTYAPVQNTVNCTVFLNGTEVDTRSNAYPLNTTVNIGGLIGSTVYAASVECTYSNGSKSPTSNVVSFTTPPGETPPPTTAAPPPPSMVLYVPSSTSIFVCDVSADPISCNEETSVGALVSAVAVNEDDTVFVSDYGDDSVDVCSDPFTTCTTTSALATPSGIDFSTAGVFFMVFNTSGTSQVMGCTYNSTNDITCDEENAVDIPDATDIAIADSNNIAYISQTTDPGAIQRCIVTGTTLSGCQAMTGSSVTNPKGLVAADSKLFVAEDNAVSVCTDSSGNLSCTETGGFTSAFGLAVSGSMAYVSISTNNTVMECTISGSSLTDCQDIGETFQSVGLIGLGPAAV